MLERLLTTLFPKTCIQCETIGRVICPSCLKLIKQELFDKNIPSFVETHYSYKNPTVRKLIWNLKYKNQKEVAELLTTPLSDEVLARAFELATLEGVKEFFVIPIPLHKQRLTARGYNQSELIALELIKMTPSLSLSMRNDILRRTKKSLPNAKTHSRKERAENTKNSMELLTREDLSKSFIILVDDVYTSGSTIKEAVCVLKQAKAKHIFAYTLAH